ncbi:hypothetical protein LTR36_010911 [Oleoguttula mirabilis]|uniref:C2 domain-containing protein n=1 Tax=Oleoguttula mirabilis TaxID=1507867 RepID=A0AAV9J4C8_9PEZI|nr:hypothetical protein LTR36_010911 [Oleoguttula mirabilis]
MPLIGAAQIAFINPPVLKLDFTGAASIADLGAIHGAVCNVILTIIEGMAVLPNRFLVTVDANNDYFKTYLYPLGTVRVTVEKAWGFAEKAKSSTKKFFSKLTRASPDCYAKINVGAEESWKTSTKNNTTNPIWGETHDFVVSDFDQYIKVDVEDEDVGGDDEVGVALTTVHDILLAGGTQELTLFLNEKETEGKISVACQFFEFGADGGSFSATDHQGAGRLCGLVTILVAGVFGIQGKREELKPSVVVTWGAKHHFRTAIQADSVGSDINNPAFNEHFRIPVTTDMVGSGAEGFRFALMNGEKEVGGANVAYADVLRAPGMLLQDRFDVGGGATVRASICLQGVRASSMQGKALPQRQR